MPMLVTAGNRAPTPCRAWSGHLLLGDDPARHLPSADLTPGTENLVEVDIAGTPLNGRYVQCDVKRVQHLEHQAHLCRRFAGLQVGQPAAAHLCGDRQVCLGAAESSSSVPNVQSQIPCVVEAHRHPPVCAYVPIVVDVHVRSPTSP